MFISSKLEVGGMLSVWEALRLPLLALDGLKPRTVCFLCMWL